MAHATSISAITIATKDIEESKKFYNLLGGEIVHGDENFVSYKIAPGQFINLQRVDNFDSKTWGRAIIHVNDVDAFYNKITSAGFKAEFEPSDAPWKERYFHIRDPAGHEISFAKPL